MSTTRCSTDVGGSADESSAEICDGLDNDCDGQNDNGLTMVDYWPDDDGDLRGDAASPPTATCDGPPVGMVANADDCDDTCDTCWTGHSEMCDPDDDDEDCDGFADDLDVVGGAIGKLLYYPDLDTHTFGDEAAASVAYCDPPAGVVVDNSDCDDSPSVCGAACNPAVAEVCDGWDNDCNNMTDDGVCTGPPPQSVCSADNWCWGHPFPTGVTFHDVGGTATDDVWAVGGGGLAYHWDGAVWSQVATGVTEILMGVWALAPNDVWAVGTAGTALHWTGSSWIAETTGTTNTLHDVWGAVANDVWLAGGNDTSALRWNGAVWSPDPSVDEYLFGIHGIAADDVWLVGNLGRAFHWNGSSWSARPTGHINLLRDVWMAASNDVWAVGEVASGQDGETAHWTGAWSFEPDAPDGISGIASGVFQRQISGRWDTVAMSAASTAAVGPSFAPARGMTVIP